MFRKDRHRYPSLSNCNHSDENLDYQVIIENI